MRLYHFFLIVSVLILTSCIPGCRSVGEQKVVEETAPQQPAPAPTEPLPTAQPVPSDFTPTTEKEQIVQETPKFVINALQWAQDYRAAFSTIGKLRALAKGNYSLKEGETAPDIHMMQEKLHTDFEHVLLPAGQEDLKALMAELDTELAQIVGALSKPPTAVELDAANTQRESLRSKIDILYQRLQAARAVQ